MKKNFLYFLFALLFFHCSVKAPEVKITGEKTALENQIIGTYQEIEQDSWTIASVRSTAPGKAPAMSEEKKKVLSAVQNRKFNKDDINEFKRDGLIGENNKGFLEIREPETLTKDAELQKRVDQIIADENNDRQVIMQRTIQINEEASKAGDETVSKVFAKLFQDESEPETWIQLDDGTWMKKK